MDCDHVIGEFMSSGWITFSHWNIIAAACGIADYNFQETQGVHSRHGLDHRGHGHSVAHANKLRLLAVSEDMVKGPPGCPTTSWYVSNTNTAAVYHLDVVESVTAGENHSGADVLCVPVGTTRPTIPTSA